VRYSTEFPIRFGEIDHARVVYYPRFYHIFHRAFENWFDEALGLRYAEIVGPRNMGFPSVHVETDFLKPLRYGERVRIEIDLTKIGTRSITCSYKAYRLPDGELAARASITTVCIDNDSFKAVHIPDDIRERFERFKNSSSG